MYVALLRLDVNVINLPETRLTHFLTESRHGSRPTLHSWLAFYCLTTSTLIWEPLNVYKTVHGSLGKADISTLSHIVLRAHNQNHFQRFHPLSNYPQ